MSYDYNESTALIIGMTDTDEKVTAASGRISTQEGTALSIWDKSQDREKNKNLIGKVTASGHTSTVEHTYFNLAFQNVTAVVEQFIIEFRLASFTVKSRRYVNFSDAGFYVPDFGNDEIKASYTEKKTKMFLFQALLTQFIFSYGEAQSFPIKTRQHMFKTHMSSDNYPHRSSLTQMQKERRVGLFSLIMMIGTRLKRKDTLELIFPTRTENYL